MPNAHAKLQPSAAKRWLNCPGSVSLCENVVDAGSEYAAEGTACHEICEQVLNGKPWPKAGEKMSNGVVVTDEMLRLCKPCVDFVQDYQDATGAVIHTEARLEIGAHLGLPEGLCFGTSDIVGTGRELLVADFKFGYNEVDVEENKQLILYALGAAKAHPGASKVRLAILQPKCGEPKEKVYSSSEMVAFWEDIQPKAHVAAKGGALVPGPWCGETYCKARAVCPALRDEMVALAQREFASNALSHTPEELADLLHKLELLEPAAKAIRSHALTLMELGTEIPGWKRVMGDTKEAWLQKENEKATAESLKKMGVDPWEKCLVSPANAREQIVEVLVGKKAEKTKKAAREAAREMLKKLAGKPQGRPTLARAEDPRPALGPAFTAADVQEAEAASVAEID